MVFLTCLVFSVFCCFIFSFHLPMVKLTKLVPVFSFVQKPALALKCSFKKCNIVFFKLKINVGVIGCWCCYQQPAAPFSIYNHMTSLTKWIVNCELLIIRLVSQNVLLLCLFIYYFCLSTLLYTFIWHSLWQIFVRNSFLVLFFNLFSHFY